MPLRNFLTVRSGKKNPVSKSQAEAELGIIRSTAERAGPGGGNLIPRRVVVAESKEIRRVLNKFSVITAERSDLRSETLDLADFATSVPLLPSYSTKAFFAPRRYA